MYLASPSHRAAISLRSCTLGGIALVAVGMAAATSALATDAAAGLGWTPRYVTLPVSKFQAQSIAAQAAASATIPYWTTSIVSPLDHRTYSYSMVGGSPYAATKTNTNVQYVPIVARVHFGTTVLDPTLGSTCDGTPVASRFFNSPLFQPAVFISNGVNVSTGVSFGTQLASAFQRANYWSAVKGTGYGVTLTPTALKPIVVDITAPAGSPLVTVKASCGKSGKIGEFNINAYDTAIQSIINKYSTPTQLPIVLTYNVVQTDSGGCCILGYHNAVSSATGVRTYAVGSVIDGGVFSKVDDTTVWSHEITEWLDDPFVNNATPAWGHIGQVSGCQSNLETGDPLSGTETSIVGVGGYIYHYQDLAFYDWFYRTPSASTGGKYSFTGNFSSVQATVCH